MKLNLENSFPAEPNTVWDTFNDPAFEARLEEASGVVYQTLDEQVVNGIEVRRIKCTAKKELPGIVAKALGANHLSYTQVNRLDRAKNRLEWEVIPMALADKVVARGVTTLTYANGVSKRLVDGEITVKIPLVGGSIEKTIVNEVRDSYMRAAEVALKMMKGA